MPLLPTTTCSQSTSLYKLHLLRNRLILVDLTKYYLVLSKRIPLRSVMGKDGFIDRLANKATATIKEAPGNIKDARERSRAPSTPYKPAGIETGAPISAAERMATSRVLNNPAMKHKPPPPPIRRGAAGSGGSPTPSSPASYSASGPPRPPPRTNSSSSGYSAPPPSLPARSPPPVASRGTPAPPYEHAVAHDLPKPAPPPRSTPNSYGARDRASSSAGTRKPFSQYGMEEKEELFGMLDEFFAARLNINSVSSPPVAATPSPRILPHRSAPASISPATPSGPPPVALTTRPTSVRNNSRHDGPSYPPIQTHSSSALSILHYILYSSYTTDWFLSPSPTPDPLKTRNDIRWTGSWVQRGDEKSLIGFCLFGDCSVAWWKLSWSARDEQQGRLRGNAGNVKKEGCYRPIPNAWDGERLYNASEMYGAMMVDFAHQAVAGRRPVARGECWDVANSALENIVNARPDLPKPFPSIARTHGHLTFYGRAGEDGRWRGGDAYVRPGDVVEWRSVTIREVGMAPGAYSKLGDPEHTAVITAVGAPTSIPVDGQPYPISALVSLTVVEQSQGALPTERTYDMAAMSAGEIWIYRPVPLEEYTGTDIGAEWPPRCQTWRVGDLE